jgi:uncharacterized protein
LDSSALVKLIVAEPESGEVVDAVARWSAWASSIVALAEVGIAARRAGRDVVRRADRVLAALDLVPLDEAVVDLARTGFDPTLRALDAIHVASALAVGEGLGAMVTFDRRQRKAARHAGLAVVP